MQKSKTYPDFDVYKLTNKNLGNYGEWRVAEILMSKGWTVYEPILDSYIDLVAFIRKCKNCGTLQKHQRPKCDKCEKERFSKIYRIL